MRDLLQLMLQASHLVVKRVQICGLMTFYTPFAESQAIARSLVQITSYARVVIELVCGENDIVTSSRCSLSHDEQILG